MRRTLFAGLTQLDPTEPLSTDSYSFQSSNPDIIDRLLEVGAVTHHHDAHAALADPITAPDATLIIGGGQIPSDQSIEFAYTLIDAYRGETKASPVKAITTRSKILEPQYPPTATPDYTAGALPPDSYYYGLTYVDGAGGETTLGAITVTNVEAGHANAQVLLTGLSSGMALASAAGWKLYKAVGGSDFAYCASGTTDSYIDAAACVDGLQPPPQVNTTQRYASIEVSIPVLPAGATGYKLYGTVDSGVFDTFSFLASGGVSGETVLLTTFSPTFGKPPERSLALPGAAKINPETDIANWTWRPPVTNFSDLPGGSLGQVRLVTSTGELYAVLTASTGAPSGWTNVSPSGTVKYVSASGGTRVTQPSEIIFDGASGASVVVTRVGGSAKVTIVAGGAGGGGTADGSDIHIAGSAGIPTLLNRDYVEYAGSGGANVAIQDLGGGSARVLIGSAPGSTGPAGPAGDGTLSRVTGSAGTPVVTTVRHLEFQASGGASVRVMDMGGGSASVLVGVASAYRKGHTFALMGDIAAFSAPDTNAVPPYFVALQPAHTAKVLKMRHKVGSGAVTAASAFIKLRKNGVDMTGFAASATTTAASTFGSVAVVDDDQIELLVTAVGGSPKNLTVTVSEQMTPAPPA